MVILLCCFRNDRRAEERERRLKQPWTAGSPPPVESPGIEVVKVGIGAKVQSALSTYFLDFHRA